MKRKLLFAIVALMCSMGAYAQASYNHTYTEGVTVAAGGNYFLYNIGSKRFYTDGMNYGTHASADHAGRVVTLAAVSGGFTIYSTPFSANGSDAKAGFLYKNAEGEPYVDGVDGDKVTVVFTPVNVDGYTNAYTIKIDDTNYLYYSTAEMGSFLRYGNNTGDNYSYWLIVPMTARQAVGDCTYLLRNGDFNHPWELPMWTNEAGWTNPAGGKKENTCAEMYGKGFDIYQTISETITNGRYKLYNQAFYNNADPTNQTYLYANSDQSAIAILNANGEGTDANMASASDAFTAGKYVNSVETFVSNGSLKVGIKNATSHGYAWSIMNNFHLEYLGQCVMDYAVELPSGGAMEADTWYYFDIAVAGDNYDAKATTLDKIICTDNGYALTSATSGYIDLTAENNDLAAKRYYVKSSSANNLVVAPKSFTYELGSITAQSIEEEDYIKTLTTFVVTYGDAATNDGNASLAIIGSPVATLMKGGVAVKTGTLTANNPAKTLTATFSDVDLVLNSNDYSIEIPAGAFGYEDKVTNAAITVNFNTPLFADGTFYLKNKGNNAYFAAGLDWSSKSITNAIGHVVDITALPNGKFSIDTHVSNGGDYHYLGSNLFCDSGQEDWTFASDGDGVYTISNSNGYLQANAIGVALSQTNSASAATKWTLMTAEAWKAEQVARLNAATANNGVDATFYLPDANFNRHDNTENAKWQGGPGLDGTATNFNAQKRNTNPFDVYQVLTELKPGKYKLTMQGFYCNGTTDDQEAILYANSYEVALVNIKSANVTKQDAAKGFTTENSGVYVPNTQFDAALTFDNRYYNNELDFTVGSNGQLRIGVKKDAEHSGDWTVFDNFQLTYYGVVISEDDAAAACAEGTYNVQLSRTLVGGQWNGFSLPFSLTSEQIAASALNGATIKQVASVTDNVITLETTDVIVAGKPYLVKPASNVVNPTFDGVTVSNPAEASHGDGDYKFKAHLYATDLPIDGTVAYVSTTDSSIKKLTSGSIKGLRAIFNIPKQTGNTEVKPLNVNFGDDTTGILLIDAEGNITEGAIYNLAGQRVNKVQKGIYIQNGKKIYVK